MKRGFLLGLDWGGGGVRALLADVAGGRSVLARRELAPIEVPGSGGFGFRADLEGSRLAFGAAVREALAAAGAASEEVLGIAATSVRFGHAVIGPGGAVLDSASNREARGAGEAFRLAAESGAELAARSGHWPQAILAAPRLARLRAVEPRLADPEARFLSLGDWVAWWLSGRAATDRSAASHSGLFDLAAGDWMGDWIERLGLPRTLFPAVGAAGECLGPLRPEAAVELGLPAGIPVGLGGSDSACALAGTGALAAGARLVVAGSTAPVLAVSERPCGAPELWDECHLLPGLFLVDANAGPLGETLAWLAAWLEPGAGAPVAQLLARAAGSEPGAGGILSSFGAQRFDARRLRLPVGSLFAVPLFHAAGETTRGRVARAAVEGLALGLRENLAQLGALPLPTGALAVTGGLTQSPFWCQLLADVLGREIEVSATPEATALGAALCAGVAAGVFSDLPEATRALVAPARVCAPDAGRAARYAEQAEEARELDEARAAADALGERRALQGFGRAGPAPALRGPAARPTILATADLDAAARAALEALGPLEHASFRERGRLLSGPDLIRALRGKAVFVTEVDLVDAAVLADLPELRVVASCRGDAVNVDVEACSAHGIPVLHAPGRNAEAVADLTLAFLLLLARKLPAATAFLRQGDIEAGDIGRLGQAFTAFRGRELGRASVGLVGFGAVGRAVARRLRSFGTRVLVHDPLVDADVVVLAGAEGVSLETLLRESDFVSLHAPVTDATRGLLGAAELARMKPGAALVNTARAALVDEAALEAALASGQLSGAALDVFAVEPPGHDHPLLARADVIATPHVGGNTVDVAGHQGRIVAADLERLLRGERPLHALNPAVLDGFDWTEPRALPDAATRERLASRPPPAVSDLQRERPARPRRAATAAAGEARLPSGAAERMGSILEVFLARALASDALRAAARERTVTLHFRIPDLGREFHLRLANGSLEGALTAPAGAADVELRLSADVLDGMFTGRLNAMQAALDGRLSFTGDTAKAMTLQQLQGELARCYRRAREEIGDPGPLVAAAVAAPATGEVAADDPRLELIRVLDELYAQGLVTATGGNLSVRIPGRDELWITPSQLFKGDLRPELMVRIDLQGRPLDEGTRAPSSERLIHCAIYRARSEAGAVIHAHAPHATILANTDLPFLPISTEAAFFGNIPRVPFIMPGTEALAKAVGEAAQQEWAVLLRNHGLIVAGRSLRRAADSVEIIERSAEVILGCYAVGREPPVLPAEAVRTLRRMGDLMA
jgi:phosphoglycerate dehydrogenase-like enzyme/sugar (pentulose or hexulose) kinase/ribulose-5-phosphate 4-epimerase/fuculose-1-phosphate aldolase